MDRLYKLQDHFADIPETVEIILLVSLFFLSVAFGLFLVILLSRLKDGWKYRRSRWMGKKSQQLITAYMFDDEWPRERTIRFRVKKLNNGFNRQVFLESLISLSQNLIGESAERLSVLYEELGLHQHSKYKLYSNSWDVIAKGICELAEMGMQQDLDLIRSFINHSHPILRSEAQVALIRLEKDAPFAFLNQLSEPLLGWQQMQLARAAHKAHLENLPAFEQWLSNEEETIVVFCLRMIVQYAQHNAVPKLLELLDHPSAELRREVLVAIRQLEAFEATEKLLEIYSHETPENKMEILKTLPAITLEDNFAFYERVLLESDRNLQLAAARAMIKSGGKGKAILSGIKDDLQHALHSVAAFALDPRI
ncbi:HEAT repeat domain-containing protein [Pontibacter harenae]|uniref:HEAT repeat domain-containing protein n=1 Tax=Pontibacter harenae TaxID=2894083 RepID=UPI001E3DDF61|nr:HEAT repeat domain-containing protein [Pontibacter harenae]MCC9167524.1 hypothetical protein [Pontibacter harenae]